MKCDRVRDDIKAYVDGELGMLGRAKIEGHLAFCAACREEEGIMRALTDEVKNVGDASAPAGLREKVLRGIEFTPVGKPKWKLRWQPVAAVGIVVIVMGAIVFPTMQSARESSRTSSSSQGMKGKPASPGLAYDVTSPPDGRPGAANAPSQRLARRAMSSTDVRAEPSLNPIIIKTGDLTIKVKDFDTAYDQSVSIAKSTGGYVTDSSAAAEGTAPSSGTLTIRVPVTAFERTVGRLTKLGTVKSRSINGQDVTGEVVDLESRLRNKRAEERQYLEIMNRARRVPDIVTVTEELSRVRGEIEEMQGRMKYLRSTAAMSTINVQLMESDKPKPKPQSSIQRTFGSAIASLGRTFTGLAAIAIWLAVYSPLWALPLGVGLYVRKRNSSPTAD